MAERATWSDFQLSVAEVLDSTESGDVMSYGDVAAEAGHPGAARAVGQMMANLAGPGGLPWWRVVRSQGRMADLSLLAVEQARRLRAEGVVVRDGLIIGWDSRRRGGLPRA